MNKEASRGNSSNKIWPLDVLFRTVLHFCEKEIMDIIHQNLPPLIHKKMFMHMIYRVRVRLSRLFIIYRWNMKQIQNQRKPEYKNSYFFRLQLSVDHLQNIYNYFHNLSFNRNNFNYYVDQIEMPIVTKRILINSNEFFKSTILQTKMHKSVTCVQIIGDKLIAFSKNKYQFTIKFKKAIKLLHFRLFYPREIDIEPVLKKITQTCIYILNHIPNPLYHCCEYLERVHMFLYFTLICKTLQSYKKIHNFTIYQNNHRNVILNFYELQAKFSLILLQTSVCIYSHEKTGIKYPIEKVEDIPTIVSKIQHYATISLFSKFKKYIEEWLLISDCFSTLIDESNYYFYFLFFDNPVSKISINSENKLQCDHPQFLTSLLTQNNKLFFEFIELLEIRLVAEYTGFLNFVLYNDLFFKKALTAIKNNDISGRYLLYLGSTNNFLKKIYRGDKHTLLSFKHIISVATNSIIYRDLIKQLSQNNIISSISSNELIMETDIFGLIKFKIDKNGYWSLKFNQSKVCNDTKMAIMFQGHTTYFRFSGWINNLISSVLATMQMIDQTFHNYKFNSSITVFHIFQKTQLYFRSFCPPLRSITYPTPPIFINLQPIQFVGNSIHYDIFEVGTCLPSLNFHFVNHSIIDISILRAIEDGLVDQRFGPFLYYILPDFHHFFEIFQGSDWQFLDISLKGTFSLMYQSKYMLYFQQQSKNSYNVAIPPVGKSIILNIPLSIFPPAKSGSSKKNKPNLKKPQLIQIFMHDLVPLRDSIITFFNEHKFLKNFGFSLLLYNSKENVILNSESQDSQELIKMRVSLGATGLKFDVLDDLSNPAIFSFDKLLSMKFSSRSVRFQILNFLFDSLKMAKSTTLGLLESLKCLLENDKTIINWEESLLNSSVNIPNKKIELHLIVNNKEYIISIDSSQESNENEDASVSIITPNGEVLPTQKLKTDFKSWLNNLICQANSEIVLSEFPFL